MKSEFPCRGGRRGVTQKLDSESRRDYLVLLWAGPGIAPARGPGVPVTIGLRLGAAGVIRLAMPTLGFRQERAATFAVGFAPSSIR